MELEDGDFLQEAFKFCDDAVWRPAKQRRKQIRALRARAVSGWAKSDIALWRDHAELGWAEGGMLLSQEFRWSVIPLHNVRAVKASSKASRDGASERLAAGFVAKAVGAAMTVQLAQTDLHSVLPFAFSLEDPDYFADTCLALLDDGVQRTLDDGPFIDKSNPISPWDTIWAYARDSIAETCSARLDLTGNRSLYAPI